MKGWRSTCRRCRPWTSASRCTPGERWSYSSTGYLLVAYVLEEVLGTTFEDLLRDRLLAPVAMSNTGVDRVLRINRGRAYGHTLADGRFVNTGNDALSPFDHGPGELYSTIGDLKLWCDALLTSLPVSDGTLQLMFTPTWARLPALDADAFRRDIDHAVDASL